MAGDIEGKMRATPAEERKLTPKYTVPCCEDRALGRKPSEAKVRHKSFQPIKFGTEHFSGLF